MIRHNNYFRTRWDIFVMLLAVYNCVSIPYTVAFEPTVTAGFNAWERLVDCIFGTDIILNFRTTFLHSKTGIEIGDFKGVAFGYVKGGRFFIDLAASIPFDLLIETFDTSANHK